MRPIAEHLEERLLLYSNLGDHFVYASRITYSFMPDGTSVGGVPSALFSTLNSNHPTATWEAQIEQAASIWEQAANVNLALVPDGGEAVGTSGNQQDDPRFGDIRIGAVPLGAGTLAVTFLPPPANGGTDAGDILLNSNINWQIGSSYDLMTVMAHEFGHAMGLGDVSTPTTDVMYGTYNGINDTLQSDDIAGIQSIYGAPQFDVYNQNGHRNNSYMTAASIGVTNNQVAIPGLDITTAGDSEWFYVSVPATTAGTMTVTVQSSDLSSLSPKLQVYNSSLGLVGTAGTVDSMGATVSVSTSVSSGQGYYIKVLAAGGYGAIGSYGLLVNMGSQSQSPIPPPDTVVAQQPDQGGGSLTNAVSIVGPVVPTNVTNLGAPAPVFTTIGNLTGWAEVLTVSSIAPTSPVPPQGGQPTSAPISTTAQNPVVPVVTGTVVIPSIGTTTPVAAVAPTSAHHHKVKHAKPLGPAVLHRVNHIKDQIKPKHHHTG